MATKVLPNEEFDEVLICDHCSKEIPGGPAWKQFDENDEPTGRYFHYAKLSRISRNCGLVNALYRVGMATKLRNDRINVVYRT
jgi:hypothetical protein